MSGSKLNLAIKRWMRRSDEFALAVVSKAFDNLSKFTVCTLHRAIMNIEMNFALAKFNKPSK
ncbi:MAG: hypothetical protein L3J11_08450 [Draconibacterium sp.]|nr:hypothetical protein [Draconibacterium sp.]